MRIKVYKSEFHALQSSGIQFLLSKKRQKYKLLQILTLNIFNFNLYYLLALHF